MTNFLEKILETKREEIDAMEPLKVLEKRAQDYQRNIIDLRWSDSLDVIAEIKRRSPSKGMLATIDNPADLASSYSAGGATAISVLTDKQYFGALEEDFIAVRNAIDIPILRKDFIIDERQVYESYLMGADIILLIVAAIDDNGVLQTLFDCAKECSLNVLVETHDQFEIEQACNVGANIIGVNVRNLSTFEEDPMLGERMIAEMPESAISIWESAIRSLADARRARDAGADAILIGQALVQNSNPELFIEQIRSL